MSTAEQKDGQILTASVTFRGKVSTSEAEKACTMQIDKHESYFVEWILHNIACSFCDISFPGKSTSALWTCSSNTVQNVFRRENEKFTSLFRRKAFLHWYTAEGMDEMELVEAESNCNDLISEYQWGGCGWDQ